MNELQAKQQLIDYMTSKVQLSESEQDKVRNAYQLKKLARKEFFFESGATCKFQGFVVSGTLRVFYMDQKMLEHVLYFAFKDWWVGDIASFYADLPTMLNVQAMEECWVLCVDRDTMEQLFIDVPPLERMFRIITQRTLSVLQKRFFLTVSANAEERFKELLQRHPGIEQLVPQHQIASYLGILPESLSRMKKQLVERNRK
jgi:CRP-like cAMP-binding protein